VDAATQPESPRSVTRRPVSAVPRRVTGVPAPDNLSTIAAYVARAEARDWDAFDALIHPEVVYEIPQSRERLTGRERLRAFNTAYPGDWHLALAESYADDTGGVGRLDWRIGGGPTDTAIAFFRFDRAGLITRITDWWPEPYEPPAGREHLVERW
jgi:hypothetical protein